MFNQTTHDITVPDRLFKRVKRSKMIFFSSCHERGTKKKIWQLNPTLSWDKEKNSGSLTLSYPEELE